MSPHRTLRPIPHHTAAVQPVLEELLDVPCGVIRAHDGCFVPEVLASALLAGGKWEHATWLRLSAESTRDVGAAIDEACMRRWRPDDRDGWGVSQVDLDEALVAAPDGAVVVVEVEGRLGRRGDRSIARFIDRAAVHSCAVVVVLHDRRGGRRVVGRAQRCISSPELEYRAIAESEWERRLLSSSGGCASVVHNVLEAAAVWPTELLDRAVGRSARPADVIGAVTQVLAGAAPSRARCALAAAARSGYGRAGSESSSLAPEALRPWLIPLEEGWAGVSPAWRSALLGIGAIEPGREEGATLRWDRVRPCWRFPERSGTAPPRAMMDCRLMGGFEVTVDGCRIDEWHGRIPPSVLRYVLTTPTRSVSRDELQEAFWPGVDPRTSRNRLQAAISAVRRAFQGATTSSVLEYVEGRYALDPALDVGTDLDRFETAAREGMAAERRGDPTAARSRYLESLELYRGDFAPDVPYDEWTILIRERLRLQYLDVLERSARLSLDVDRIDDCIDAARRMLDQDPCREDAHRLLMRCYARQGKAHLVDYQYEFCVRVLDTMLDAEPSAETRAAHREQRARAGA